MSDSEDEAAFASADEGETQAGALQKKESQKGTKASESVGKGESKACSQKDNSKTKLAQAASNNPTEGGKKGRGKQQQQRGKKKGKGSTSPREAETDKPIQKEESNMPKGDVPSKKDDSSKAAKTEKEKSTKSPPLEDQSPTVVNQPSTQLKEEKTSEPKEEDDAKLKAKQISETASSVPKTPTKEDNIESSEQTIQAGDVRKGINPAVSSPEGQSISPEQRDYHTPQQSEVLHRLEDTANQSTASSGGWGWSSWGSSLLSAASSSVQTFTHQVGDGFTTIMDTVESSLGAPDPEELAKAGDVTEPSPEESEKDGESEKSSTKETKSAEETGSNADKSSDSKEEEGGGGEGEKEEQKGAEASSSWFANWGVADLAKKVQDTGKSLASKGQTLMTEGFDAVENLAAGGIDVLETIGKKTYNTISEHDPAFRKTREYLSTKGSRPNLSSVLREAKDEAEKNLEQEKENEEARKAHFGTLFDDYQGIAHLEALEMLSNQSEKKVHSLLNSLAKEDLGKVKPSLVAIKEAFELDDEEGQDSSKEEDFTSLVGQCLSELKLGTAPDKLNKVHGMVKQWIDDFDSHESHEDENVKSVHQRSIQALAELTSKGVEQFHKAGELVLLEQDKEKDCTERAHSLARLTGVLCHEVGNLSTKFAGCLNKMAEQDSEDVTAMVTNVYLEASNSTTYIQDAFQLLLPVLQQAALEQFILSKQQS